MRELTADLLIALDGFASGVDQPPYSGYFGPGLESWFSSALKERLAWKNSRLVKRPVADKTKELKHERGDPFRSGEKHDAVRDSPTGSDS